MLADLVVKRLGSCPGRFGEVSAVAGEDDASGRVDDEATLGRLDRLLDVSALSSDARDQEWESGNYLPKLRKLFGISSARDDAAVPVGIPDLLDVLGHQLVERGLPEGETVLELSSTRVGCPCENEDALVGSRQEGLHRFASQIRMDGDCVCLEVVEDEIDIPLVGIADVGDLGVKDDRDAVKMGDLDRCCQGLDTVRTVGQVERPVRLVAGHEIVGCLDEPLVELGDRSAHRFLDPWCAFRPLMDRRWQLVVLAVEPNADRETLVPACFQLFHEALQSQHLPRF